MTVSFIHTASGSENYILVLQWLCSYLFMPVALLIGVEWSDCRAVARLLGMKTFLNEFVAYEELSVLINNRKSCALPLLSVAMPPRPTLHK